MGGTAEKQVPAELTPWAPVRRLCDLGQMTSRLCASVSSSEKQG